MNALSNRTFAPSFSASVGALIFAAACGGPLDDASQDLDVATVEQGLVSSLSPVADATVRSGAQRSTVLGTQTTLWVDGQFQGTIRRAYVQFQVNTIPVGTVGIDLVLSCLDGGAAGDLYRVDSFDERTITWNNRPRFAEARMVARGVDQARAGDTIRFDVTAEVRAPGTYAFVLLTEKADGASYSSREGATPPKLTFSTTARRSTTLDVFDNSTGRAQSAFNGSGVSATNPFFLALGTNGRTCASCHQAGEGWSVTPERIRARFDATDGLDPIFRAHDGANRPDADVSTVEKRRAAYSLLMSRGVFRVGMPMPSNAEFTLEKIEDPYGFASAAELSLFRRPLPSSNVRFVAEVMWDGRESVAGRTVVDDLRSQSNGATMGHAEGAAPLTTAVRSSIVDMERALVTAQVNDTAAGALDVAGGRGGPTALLTQTFSVGMNDPFVATGRTGAVDSTPMNVFDAWTDSAGFRPGSANYTEARAAIGRGQKIFQEKTFAITETKGLNDVLGQESVPGTCASCHNTPNVGSRSAVGTMSIGIGTRRNAELPTYTLKCTATGEVIETSDPGRAMVTGKCADIGKFRVPVLRGLAARAPYFHHGGQPTLTGVVEFYDKHFTIGMTAQEKADLEAFLRAL